MSASKFVPVRLFVVYGGEVSIMERLFADYVQNGSLAIERSGSSSSAISLAESWLLTTSNVSVALALSCPGDTEEYRRPIRSIFSRDAEEERWHIALAGPDITKWLLYDPNFAQAVQDAQVTHKFTEVVNYFVQWHSEPGNQFSREEVSKQDPEFAALSKFIEEHTLAAAASSKS